jgi:ATP/maltotriose-dependent transcriptional regulator MalT
MTASHAAPLAPLAPLAPTVITPRAAGADRAHIELRRLLLTHLALDVHPQHLAGVVIKLCAALAPMIVRPAVSVGVRADLSDRELQVLMGMASGSPNAQIGRELHLSEDTVKTYARRLYANLGVRDRAHAVARGFQLGILAVGEPFEEGGPEPVPMASPRSIGGRS